MNKIILIFINLFVFSATFQAQSLFSQASDSTVEVGIIEHLGDTIPLNLSFQNEKDSTVFLRDLINKPTILSFVYLDCPGICSPLLDGISDVIEKIDLQLGTDYEVITLSFEYNDTPESCHEEEKFSS
jgi:protein SCO1/2